MPRSRRRLLKGAALALVGGPLWLGLACQRPPVPSPAPPSAPPGPPVEPAPTPRAEAAAPRTPPATPPRLADILIGGLHPLSGPGGAAGRAVSHGVELAVEEANRSGGIASLHGARLRYLAGDSRGRVASGTAETERLLAAGAAVVVGSQSDVMLAAAELAEQARTPLLVSEAVADAITERGLKYVFRVGGSAGLAARATPRMLTELAADSAVPVRRVAIVHADAQFTATLGGLLEAEARAAGFEVAGRVAYPLVAGDLGPEVKRLRALQPEVVFVCSLAPDGLALARALAASRGSFKAVWGVLNGLDEDPRLLAELGPDAEYLIDSGYAVLQGSPEQAPLGRTVAQRWGETLSYRHVYGYLTMKIALEALERAGSTSGETLRDALSRTRLQPPSLLPWTDPVVFDQSGQNLSVRPTLVQVVQGQPRLVWPPLNGRSQAVFPIPPGEQRAERRPAGSVYSQ